MTTPNHFEIVKSICEHHWYEGLLKINNVASITELMQHIGTALADKDTNWGYVSKTATEKHIIINGKFVSVDAFIYKPTNQVVDVLSNAVDSGVARPTWQLVEKRAWNNWVEITPYTNEEDMATVAELLKRIEDLEKNTIKVNEPVAIVTDDGHYLCAEGGGGYDVNATRTQVGGWEKFKLVRPE